jgi:predicted dehydrogenase
LASLIMRTEGGALATAEVSYTMPEGYERYFSLTSTTLYCSGGLAFGTILYRDGRREEVGGAEEDWSTEYVRETLRRYAQGAAPIASLSAMVRTLRVINAAVESDRMGQPVTLPPMEHGRPD